VPPSVQSPHSSAARIGDSANANGAPLVVAVRELHLARPDGQLVSRRQACRANLDGTGVDDSQPTQRALPLARSSDAAASELDPRQGVLGVPGEVNPLV
jgi:hypothetical protein